MTLIDKKNRKEIRFLKTWAKELNNEKRKSLIVFRDPPSVRGTALLTWEQKDKDDGHPRTVECRLYRCPIQKMARGSGIRFHGLAVFFRGFQGGGGQAESAGRDL